MSLGFDFSRRMVIGTGAAQGIGLAIARSFNEAGRRIAPFDHVAAVVRSAWETTSDTVAATAVDVADVPEDRMQSLTAAVPMGRFTAHEEIASSAAFLASEEAGYVTGSVLSLAG